MNRLENKVAIVTGAGSGLGKAIAQLFTAEGSKVLAADINQNGLDALKKEIEDAGGQVTTVIANMANEDDIENMFKVAIDTYGTVDILVNNAGVTDDNLMVFMSDKQWNSVIRTNLDSFYYVTKQVLTNMIVNKWGRIINVVSLSGQSGMHGQTNYSAAKAGVIGATKSLAMEIGKKKITVNAVAPGFIKTDMTRGLDETELRKLVPLNRFGTAQEVAYVVAFLASEKASYITGETISINGGMYS